jgi:hypothetical protein
MGLSKVDLEQPGVEIYREIGMLDAFMVLSTIWLVQLLVQLCCEVFRWILLD